MSRGGRPGKVGLVVLVAVGGCTSRTTPGPGAPAAALEVTMAGCASVLDTGACEVTPSGHLTVWVRGLRTVPQVAGASSTATAAVAGGLRMTLRPDVRASKLAVTSTAGYWEVRILQPGLTSRVDDWDRATTEKELPGLTGRARARALHHLGRLMFREGRGARAADTLEAAAQAAEAHRDLGAAARSRMLLAFIAIYDLRAFARARESLTAVRGLRNDGRGQVLRDYHEGLLLTEMGDFRGALRRLDRARGVVDRLGLDDLTWMLDTERARTLLASGRGQDAVEQLETMRARHLSDLPPCGQADLLTNLSWARLRHERTPGEDVAEHLRRARALYRDQCARAPPSRRANVLVNLGLHCLRNGRVADARRWFVEASRFREQPDITQWRRAFEADLTLEGGAPRRALKRYEDLGRWARTAGLGRLEWHAKVGQGRALAALKRPAAAIERLSAAEAMLDQQGAQVPLERGRLQFFEDRDDSARWLVALLVETGNVEGAFGAVRRASRRVVTSVLAAEAVSRLDGPTRRRWEDAVGRYKSARDALERATATAWAAPKSEVEATEAAQAARSKEMAAALDDALAILAPARADTTFRPAAAGELMLSASPSTRGWLLFAADQSSVRVRRTSARPVKEDWVRLFANALRRAKIVTVLPGAQATGVSFAELDLDGAPLLKRRRVEYRLDLPPRRVEPPTRGDRRAVVIADTRGDLAGARAEQRAVTGMLTRAGWAVRTLGGRGSSAAVARAAIEGAELMHYAGHGVFEGRSGASGGVLFDEATLGIGDVLTLSAVPRWVVLSGCETAKQPATDTAVGLGLAHAFILRGSEWVVAAPAPVRDAVARSMSQRLYERVLEGTAFHRAYRAAALQAGPEASLAGFIVIGR